MSRSIKGSKGPGWEPWSNLEARQKLAASQRLEEHKNAEAQREIEINAMLNDEATEALYCHEFGPCAKCRCDE